MKTFFKSILVLILCVSLSGCSAIASRAHRPLNAPESMIISAEEKNEPLVYYKGTKWNWKMMRDIYKGRYSIPAAVYGHVVYIVDTPFSLVFDHGFLSFGMVGKSQAFEKFAGNGK